MAIERRIITSTIKRVGRARVGTVLGRAVLLLGVLAISGVRSEAYTVEISTNTALEQQWLNATAEQFSVVITTNPFFPNTYTMSLLAINPNYNPPPTNAALLQNLVTVDSYTYLYGYADGQEYQQYTDSSLINAYGVECSTPTNFTLVETTTSTFSRKTCTDVLNTILQAIYEETFSSPTVVPGNWQ